MADAPVPATISRPKSSIDLDVGRVEVLTHEMMVDARMLVTALSDPDKIDKHKIEGAIAAMLRSLPAEFKAEIRDMEAFKKDISDAIIRFAQRIKGREATEDDTQLYIMDVMSIFTKHQAFNLIDNRALDANALAKDYEPEVTRRHLSLGMQRLISVVTFAAATITSWMTLTEWGGVGLDYLKEASNIALSPENTLLIRQLVPVPVALYFSRVVMQFKNILEKRSQDDDINILRSTGRTVKEGFKTPRSSALTVAASLILLFDVATNVTGLMTWALGRKSNEQQITCIQDKIDERTKLIRDKLVEIGQVPAHFGAQAEEVINTERGGVKGGKAVTSETGKGGVGPMFHAKSALYTENRESKEYLEARSGAPAKKNKAAVTPGATLSGKLLAALKASKLLDGSPFEAEIQKIITAETAKIDQRLKDIKEAEKSLDFTKETEMIQADVDAITAQMDAVIKLINTELAQGVGNRVDQYEKVNKALLDIARAAPEFKGTFDASKKMSWKVPNIAMDNSPIKFEQMKHIGFAQIGEAMEGAGWDASEKAFFGILFTLMAITSSYGDLITLGRTRKRYGEDRKEVEKKQQEWSKQFKDKIITMLCLTINKGPFAHYLAPGAVISPATVESILNERIQELVVTPPEQEPEVLTRGQKFARGLRNIVTKQTDVAIDHNKQVMALKEILTNPDETALLLEQLLPGLALLKKPQAGDNPHNIIQKNTGVVLQRNLDIQKNDLGGIRQKLEGIHKAGSNSLSMQDWSKNWDSLLELPTSLRNMEAGLLPENQALFQEIREQGNDTITYYIKLLSEIVDRETLKMMNDLNDSTPNEVLDANEKLVNKLLTLIPVPGSGVSTTASLEAGKARGNAEGVLVQIQQIRSRRVDDVGARARLTRMSDRMALAEGHVLHIGEWTALKNGASSPNDKRLADSFVRLVFGKSHVIVPLSATEKISSADAVLFEKNFADVNDALDDLVSANPARTSEIDGLKVQLAEGMDIVRKYFPDAVVPAAEASA